MAVFERFIISKNYCSDIPNVSMLEFVLFLSQKTFFPIPESESL